LYKFEVSNTKYDPVASQLNFAKASIGDTVAPACLSTIPKYEEVGK